MPLIRPISDLRNNFDEISDLCHNENEPVFITRNGKGDLVVMSLTLYEQQKARFELYQKLDAAEEQGRTCKDRASHKDVMARLKKATVGKMDD
jgi:prevent-host-death family protein